MDIDYEYFNKGEGLFTKVTYIYIYIHVNTDSNKNIASFRSVRCLSNFNQTSFFSLSLSVHVDKRRKNRSVPYGQRSCTGCCSFIRGDQLARRMADNGSIKKSCYCRVAVENFDVAKQDGKPFSISNGCLALFKKNDFVSYLQFTSLFKDNFYEQFTRPRNLSIHRIFSSKYALTNQICRCSSTYIYILGEFKRFRNNAAAG